MSLMRPPSPFEFETPVLEASVQFQKHVMSKFWASRFTLSFLVWLREYGVKVGRNISALVVGETE